jgi:hypothetical protein
MNYLLAFLTISIILVVSLVTPIAIVMRCLQAKRKEPDQFEGLRFRAVISLLIWLIPTSRLWLGFALAAGVLAWPEPPPEPGRDRLVVQGGSESHLKGYLVWFGFLTIYSVTCYLLVRWNSPRRIAAG